MGLEHWWGSTKSTQQPRNRQPFPPKADDRPRGWEMKRKYNKTVYLKSPKPFPVKSQQKKKNTIKQIAKKKIKKIETIQNPPLRIARSKKSDKEIPTNAPEDRSNPLENSSDSPGRRSNTGTRREAARTGRRQVSHQQSQHRKTGTQEHSSSQQKIRRKVRTKKQCKRQNKAYV